MVRKRLGGSSGLGILCAVTRALRDNGFFNMFTSTYKVVGEETSEPEFNVIESLEETMSNKVDQLAGKEGFWKSDAKEKLIKQGLSLVNTGMTVDEAYRVIENIYYIASAEYGN